MTALAVLARLAEAFPALAWASLGAALLAAIVALLARSRFAPPPRVLAVLWWLVAAKAIVALLWSAPLPVLPAHPAAARAAVPAPFVQGVGSGRHGEIVSGGGGLATSVGFDPATGAMPATFAAVTESAAKSHSPPTLIAGAAVGLWLLGALAALGLAARQTLRLRGVVRRATAVADRAVCARLERLAEQLGVTRAPYLKISCEIDSALVCGLGRGTILLPARASAYPSAGEDLDLVLAHELLHLRHRDLLWGLVPALAARLLFFHPLVRLAAREHVLAIEAARDREVLACLEPEPERYGRLLVRWGVAPWVTVASAAAASPTFTTLRRRLEMLEQRTRHFGAAGIVALAGALLLALPVHPVAAWAGDPSTHATAAPSPAASPTAAPAAQADDEDLPPPPPAPSAAPRSPRAPLPPPAPPRDGVAGGVPGGIEGGVSGGVRGGIAGGVAPVPPVPPVPAVPPVPPVPPRPAVELRGPLQSLALISPDGTMSIQSGRTGRAPIERLKKEGRDLLWFRWKDQDYIIRDAAIVDRARVLFKAEAELGARQAELGSQQAELGARQAELGGKQAQLGAEQARLAADYAASAARRERPDEQAFAKRQDELGHEQDLLGRQQDELGRQQDELGKRQSQLGREQEKASVAATVQLHDLLERALADGKAQKDE